MRRSGGGTCTASGSGNINDTVNLPSGRIGDVYRDGDDIAARPVHYQHGDGDGTGRRDRPTPGQ